MTDNCSVMKLTVREEGWLKERYFEGFMVPGWVRQMERICKNEELERIIQEAR